jgi:predicted dehydrogenase
MFRVHEKELGGGIMLDIGHYSVHLATLVFGAEKPEKVPSTFQQLLKELHIR